MISSRVLMIRPVRFGFNSQTAASNSFQTALPQLDEHQLQELALLEFDNALWLLRANGIEVLVYEDTPEPHTPDSIFPNNWLQTTPQGCLYTFPMQTPNRRDERRDDIIADLQTRYGYRLDRHLEQWEARGMYLEGTGCLIPDYEQNTVYAALSSRCHPEVLDDYARTSGYEAVAFGAYGKQGEALYHTNVMLGMGPRLAWWGAAVTAPQDRPGIEARLKASGRNVLLLSREQIYEHFAGNMLALRNSQGEHLLVCSTRARRSLTGEQLHTIQTAGYRLLPLPIPIIETIGGGSARCMLAELF